MRPTNQANSIPNAARRTAALLGLLMLAVPALSDETLLVRQPSISAEHVVFAHGGDLWVSTRSGGDARRLTSTPGVESDPHFSPDGSMIAFSSNQFGSTSVFVVPVEGGDATRLTWYPASDRVRGWSPDGEQILYASSRGTAPTGFDRLWTVSQEGGPSTLVPAPWGHDGWYAPDGSRLIVDRVARWDGEWRHYRGGQNTPLVVLDLESLEEQRLPNPDRTIDIQPVWLHDHIYFLSDRDWTMNVWSFDPSSGALRQITEFEDRDIKWLGGTPEASGVATLVLEHGGRLHTLPVQDGAASGPVATLEIEVRGDFPWKRTRWEDVGRGVRSAAISPSGKRAVFEARGDIFTVPVEHGDARNLTSTSDAADREPVWSPDGQQVAWFSDVGGGYRLQIGSQDGLDEPRTVDIGVSKMAWEATWSPDGKHIAFVDDDVRVRVIDLDAETVSTIDVGGTNLERGSMGPTWSPDSKHLAYAKSSANGLRRIMVWTVGATQSRPATDGLADAFSPAWDRDGKHLYLLASTDVALGSGWANTSAMGADPRYAPYVLLLDDDTPTPFEPRSDEEDGESEEQDREIESDGPESGNADTDDSEGEDRDRGEDSESDADSRGSDGKKAATKGKKKQVTVTIDWGGIERRVVPVPMPTRRYRQLIAGPAGSFFVLEFLSGGDTQLHKFNMEKREAKEFVEGARQVTVSDDGNNLLLRQGRNWRVVGAKAPPKPGDGQLGLDLQAKVDRGAEWQQMFDEAWRYQRDFFYDPGLHGRDWEAVRRRYEPLLPHVRHRADLNYVLDMMNGELSVGHSFVFGGDLPDTDDSKVGVLGADLVADSGRWRIERIFRDESWNPNLRGPLDRPGLKVSEGDYLVAVNGSELSALDDPYELLDGTAERQTILHINDAPTMGGAHTVTVVPLANETGLRRRAWIEDNRRRVDELSGGRLAYVWVPNTSGAGVRSFNRYLFAQQDKDGAIIDERYNGGGLLDDYMVDLMTRKLRAAITNEVPDGQPMRLPAGILGPKVLLINELAGSGGDFFPWVFRQQNAGPLVGARTWGGLVKSSVHYPLMDGGALTAPDNAIFDPINGEWVGENVGIPPDIEVVQDAKSVAAGGDPQLERAVAVALELLAAEPPPRVVPPRFPRPTEPPGR